MTNKIIITAILIIMLNYGFAQDYQISFAAAGDETSIETVEVQNLTQETTLSLNGSDMLHLVSEISAVGDLIQEKESLSVFPNPMQHKTTLNFTLSHSETHRIHILNIEGKSLISKNQYLIKGNHSFEISGLQSGIYMVRIASESGLNDTKKIIVTGSSNNHPELKYTGLTRPLLAKSAKETVQMQYNDGDLLLFKGISGDYSSILTAVPAGHGIVTFMLYACTDIDENHYTTVNIGDQVWMAEDLRVTNYPNSDEIPNVTDNATWINLGNSNNADAYCFYNNDNNTDYGALYTYAAAIGDNWEKDNADGQGVCPDGWHLPTDAEWTELINNFNGGQLKESGTTHWSNPNTGATNESGFTAIPNGYRGFLIGAFYSVGISGCWWSADEFGSTSAWTRYLSYDTTQAFRVNNPKSNGFSVRCVKDE